MRKNRSLIFLSPGIYPRLFLEKPDKAAWHRQRLIQVPEVVLFVSAPPTDSITSTAKAGASMVATAQSIFRNGWRAIITPIARLVGISVLALLLVQPARAAFELTTPDGRQVRLNDDHTWEYLTADEPQTPDTSQQQQAVLRVAHVDEMEGDSCRIGVVLENRLPYRIKNLAFRFYAFKSETLPYDSVTRNFFEIKSTDDQYHRLFFRGIRCSDIHHIHVEDPGRCAMGDLDKFSTRPGDCLEHVRVEPSDLIRMVK